MNGWKIATIILFIVVVLESVFIIWLWNLGTEMIENENECSINICANYDAYLYDNYEKMCYCYEDDEVVYSEFIRS